MTNNNDLYYIVLAAGKGTRMKSNKTKVLHKIFHTPMLKLLTDELLNSKQDAVIVTAEESSEITNLYSDNPKVKFVTQYERLGTGHAVKIALTEYRAQINNKTLIILYGDTPFITKNTIKKLSQKIAQGNNIVVTAFKSSVANQYGRLVLNKGKLQKIVEFKDASDQEKKIELCNSGIIAINHQAFYLIDKIENNNEKKEYYLTDLISLAVEHNLSVDCLLIDEDEVQGINDKTDLANANKYYLKKQRLQALESGVTLIDPDSTYISHKAKFGKDITIEPNVMIIGDVTIGDNTIIKSFSHLEDCRIDADNIVGPYARIRPGTQTQEKVKIGNFVEIKESNIGKSSKINHLSYIGDATLESNVNVGAGTITCNYNGFKKYKTTIKEGAFIGSNSSLIAPVTIAEDSIIAAGSTITRDNKKDSITIARAKQQELDGAAKIFRKKQTKN
jgi:bifunctional UDP-N-acetylglucosamine pyrophosphorylase/glucosamine-1-phosphate N-acetyltransferase